jgi:hypothetical protein
MKRCKKMEQLLWLSLAAMLSASALAQGTVRFNNSSYVVAVVSATDETLKRLDQGSAQLFYAPAGTAYRDFYLPSLLTGAAWLDANPGWTLGPITAISSGYFDGGVVEVAGITPGSVMDYVVIGYAGTATTFDEALQAGEPVGVSTPKQSILTGGVDPSLPPPELASQGLYLALGVRLIPEPSSFGLAGLAAMAFWLFRRKQR